MPQNWIFVLLLCLILMAVLPHWRYSTTWGYAPSGVIGFILVVVVILALLGRI